MKLLLTSGGITNKTIAKSLRKLLGKPFQKSKLVFIPTAANISPGDKDWLINDLNNCRKLGFREIDVLNIDATSSERMWRPRIESADVMLFGGGNTFYLLRWFKKSGLAKALHKLLKTKVYVGISAGSIAAAPNLSLSGNKNYDLFKIYYEDEAKESPAVTKGLGLVKFHIRPHFNSPHFPHARATYIREIAKKTKEPIYAIDDNSAIEVTNGKIRVVSEGKYLIFNQ
jgi:dipeptidase E